MLFAGAGASDTPARGGALTFGVDASPLWANWAGGSANMLLAGAGADTSPAWGGALAFHVSSLPSWAAWAYGSAEKHIGLYYF